MCLFCFILLKFVEKGTKPTLGIMLAVLLSNIIKTIERLLLCILFTVKQH